MDPGQGSEGPGAGSDSGPHPVCFHNCPGSCPGRWGDRPGPRIKGPSTASGDCRGRCSPIIYIGEKAKVGQQSPG